MPRGKRTPIDYRGEFGGSIFRPKDVVESELAELQNPIHPAADSEPDVPNQPIDQSQRDVSNERTNERTRVRHSFDVYQDQLRALTGIQARLHERTGRKPKIGDLVQEALDAYIAHGQERSNDRLNERSNERT